MTLKHDNAPTYNINICILYYTTKNIGDAWIISYNSKMSEWWIEQNTNTNIAYLIDRQCHMEERKEKRFVPHAFDQSGIKREELWQATEWFMDQCFMCRSTCFAMTVKWRNIDYLSSAFSFDGNVAISGIRRNMYAQHMPCDRHCQYCPLPGSVE